MLGLRGAEGEFFLLACDGYEKQPWKVFSSAADTWTETDWPTTNGFTNTAFFVVETRSVYYHINGQDHWTVLG